jgi:polar amino acid transport system substrate-binding protein
MDIKLNRILTNVFLFGLLLQTSIFSKELRVVFSQSTPPYVFKDGSGIVMTIAKEALAYKGHTIKPVFVNISRSLELFKHGHVDATTIIQTSSGLEAFYSDYFMQYHNAAFSLKSKQYTLKKMEELKNYNFIAFQSANKYLGNKFGLIAKDAGKRYSEVADQKKQVYMLLQGHTDFVVMDRHIFAYYKNELISEGKVDKHIQIDLFEFFSPTKYQTAFNEKSLRDDFNEGIKHLKKTGRYDEIFYDYSEKYFHIKK